MTRAPASGIDGVVVTQLREITDERGAVLHMLRSDEPSFSGFGECYFSQLNPEVVKAWKRHRVQSQNLAVPVGRVSMSVYDDRTASPTVGQIETFELGRPDAYLRVHLPSGIWYGFRCVSGSPALIANCPDMPHDPVDVEERYPADPRMPQIW